MAVTNVCIRFFAWARSKGASFSHTLTLGRLENMALEEVTREVDRHYPGMIEPAAINWQDKFSETIFKALGASGVDSLDYSDFEKASIVHDLNDPLPLELYNKYSMVVDGGTLEHVFNFPQAITNCIQSLQTGGHFIGFSPANNLMGHGLYQFSPELFYRVFSEKNGCMIKGLFMVAADFSVDTETWFEVTDPEKINERVTLKNELPSYIMVLAQKTRDISKMEKVFQHDYELRWNKKEQPSTQYRKAKRPLAQRIKQRLFPEPKEQDLERIDPGFFRKTKAGE